MPFRNCGTRFVLRLLFEEDTPYQNVKILRSQQYGNVLVLDDDVSEWLLCHRGGWWRNILGARKDLSSLLTIERNVTLFKEWP